MTRPALPALDGLGQLNMITAMTKSLLMANRCSGPGQRASERYSRLFKIANRLCKYRVGRQVIFAAIIAWLCAVRLRIDLCWNCGKVTILTQPHPTLVRCGRCSATVHVVAWWLMHSVHGLAFVLANANSRWCWLSGWLMERRPTGYIWWLP